MRQIIHLTSASFSKRKKSRRCKRFILLCILGSSLLLFTIYTWLLFSELTIQSHHQVPLLLQALILEGILVVFILFNEIRTRKWKFLVSLAVLNYLGLLPCALFEFFTPLRLKQVPHREQVIHSYWACLSYQSASIQAFVTLSLLIILVSVCSMCCSLLYIMIELVKIVNRNYQSNGGYKIKVQKTVPLPKIKSLDWNIESGGDSRKGSESPASRKISEKIEPSKRSRWQRQMKQYRQEFREQFENENLWESYFKLRSQESMKSRIDSLLKDSVPSSKAKHFSLRSRATLSHKRLLSFKRYEITVCSVCNLLILPTEAMALTNCEHSVHVHCLGYKPDEGERKHGCPLCLK